MEIQTADQLAKKKCAPCEGGVEACSIEQANSQLANLDGWSLIADGTRIRKNWKLRNFVAALDFFNRVGEIAEADGHHPDLHLEGYRNVWIEMWTHAIGGLSVNDFILAAKIDEVAPK